MLLLKFKQSIDIINISYAIV